ncbi:hypothetical protein OROGR_010484 [Orobanche gracilis]
MGFGRAWNTTRIKYHISNAIAHLMDGKEGNSMVFFMVGSSLCCMSQNSMWSHTFQRSRKLQSAANKASKDLMTLKTGSFIVAPCPHDGPCPLQNTDKYCHFAQRLERTSSQRSYKVFPETPHLC